MSYKEPACCGPLCVACPCLSYCYTRPSTIQLSPPPTPDQGPLLAPVLSCVQADPPLCSPGLHPQVLHVCVGRRVQLTKPGEVHALQVGDDEFGGLSSRLQGFLCCNLSCFRAAQHKARPCESSRIEACACLTLLVEYLIRHSSSQHIWYYELLAWYTAEPSQSSDVTLLCALLAHPPPSLTWFLP